MNPTRKFFLKIFLLMLILLLLQKPLQVGLHWRNGFWLLSALFLLLGILYPVGKPLHNIWIAYLRITTQGMRFFQGLGILSATISCYRFYYDILSGDGSRLFALDIRSLPLYQIWLGCGILLVLIGLIRIAADLFFGLWMRLAHLLQRVVSRLVLFFAYFLAVIPVGLIARLLGKNFLDRDFRNARTSYWTDRDQVPFETRRYNRHF